MRLCRRRLPAEYCTDIERQLNEHSDCRTVVETLLQTIRLYRGLPAASDELAPDMEQRLLQRLNLTEPGKEV
ncbi:MAG: hypothetical protein HC837_04495 [Chloroflexaceae bacterium]|nr:hypothetical protein [Chloroflexaceae bacterium]